MSENRCVMCGEIIPEGRQVCPKCEVMCGDPCMVDCSWNHCGGSVRNPADSDSERE